MSSPAISSPDTLNFDTLDLKIFFKEKLFFFLPSPIFWFNLSALLSSFFFPKLKFLSFSNIWVIKPFCL